MKKSIILIILNCFTLTIFAQNTILTTDGDTINAATIKQGKYNIAYKNNYGDSYLLKIPIEKIKYIQFENGKIIQYNKPNSPKNNPNAQNHIITTNGDTINVATIKQGKHNIAYRINYDDLFLQKIPVEQIKYIQFDNGKIIQYNNPISPNTPIEINIDTQSPIDTNSPLTPFYNNYMLKKSLLSKTWADGFHIFGLIYGITSGVAIGISSMFILYPLLSNIGFSIFLGVGCGILSGLINYWIPFGILNNIYEKRAQIYSIDLIKYNFEVSDLQMSTGINIFHDNMQNKNTLGIGLNIQL